MTLMNCDPATGSCRIPDAAPILPRGRSRPLAAKSRSGTSATPCAPGAGVFPPRSKNSHGTANRRVSASPSPWAACARAGATHGGRSSGSFYAGNGPISPRSPVNHSVFPCCRQSISTMTRSLPAEPLWSPSKCSTRSGLSPPRPWHFLCRAAQVLCRRRGPQERGLL